MIQIDMKKGVVILTEEDAPGGQHRVSHRMDTQEAFRAVSRAWIRAGWDTKYVYGFSWFGRPVIQLPDDMIRIQEVIYALKPDILIETGVAHGGSLVFYATLFEAMNKGRVVGIDIEIRPHNRAAIESHEFFDRITLIEGSSIDPDIGARAREEVKESDTVLVILDSNHTRDHVLEELRMYADLVSVGSYIVATDGVMGEVVGAPRTEADWSWNNPKEAALQFVAEDSRFKIEEPAFPFNEGLITERVTYWPGAFVKRVR